MEQLLKQVPLFYEIDQSRIPEVIQCLSGKKKIYEKEDYILIAGDPVSQVGIVLSGSANIITEDFWGNRSIIAHVGEGEMFGEAFACAEVAELPVSVVAAGRTEVLFIDYKKLIDNKKACCMFHEILVKNMIRILAEKNMILTQKISYLAKRSTREKLLSYLSVQAKKAGSSLFEIPFNRQELADYLSVDRSAMSGELGRLKKENILVFHKNRFQLLSQRANHMER